MAGGNFIVGGLLQGLGQGITINAQQKREDALIRLRRQFQKEDEASADQRTILTEQRAEERDVRTDARRGLDLPGKIGLLDLAQRFKREEWETEQQYAERLERLKHEMELEEIGARGAEDRRTASHKGTIDRSLAAFDFQNDVQLEEVKAANDAGKIHSVERAEDGSMLVVFNDGTKKRYSQRISGHGSGDDEDEGSTIADGRARREGSTTPTTPAATSRNAERSNESVADRAQRELDALAAAGTVPPGTYENQSMTGPNGEKARWTRGRWIIFQMPQPARAR